MRPFFVLLGIACLMSCGREQSDRPDSKNVLWLVCEDQSAQFFPMYGDRTVRLPNIESLAEHGIVYTDMNATVPVCAPARSAIITGMYPTSIGTHNMRAFNAYNPDNETSIGIPSYSPILPAGVTCFTEHLRRAGYFCTNNAKEDYNIASPSYAWDMSGPEAHWRQRETDQPFFSVFNFGVTHESQVWARSSDTLLVDPVSIPVPPFFPDDSIVRHDLAVNYSNLIRLDKQVGEIIDQLKEDGLYENTIIFFYSDHGGPFPRYKRSVYETGLLVPMIVHDPFEETQPRPRKRILPGDWPYSTDGTPLSFIDLAPTVLSIAGIEPPAHMQGVPFLGEFRRELFSRPMFATTDRFDAVYDRVRAVKYNGYKLIRNYHPELPYALPVQYRLQMRLMQRLESIDPDTASRNIAKWLATQRPREEFYDLKVDQDELHNRVDDPSLSEVIAALSDSLDQWIEATNDLGATSEDALIAQWLVKGEAPHVPRPQLTREGNLLDVRCELEGVTISCKSPGDPIWRLCGQSVDPGDGGVRIRLERIGFTPFDTLVAGQ